MCRSSVITLFAVSFGLLAATPAQAAPDTWVDRGGTDTGNCPRTAPCRTFAYAITKTGNGGTLNVLSSGDYGPVAITRSVSIVAEGVEGLIRSMTRDLEGVEAAIHLKGSNSSVVTLRGLTISVDGGRAINFGSGAALNVQNCKLRRASTGIWFHSSTKMPELYISDTVISARHLGVFADVSDMAAKIVIDRSQIVGPESGLKFWGGGRITATVRDSIVSRSREGGIRVERNGPTDVMIDHSAIVFNTEGIVADGGANIILRIGDSVFMGNGDTLIADPGVVIESYGTNKVEGNSNDAFPVTIIGHR
jgi:hypothetical protein